MIGFIGTSLQLQSTITAHSQWLSTARSIPCWTTSVFSSAVTNDERRIIVHTLNCLWFLTSLTNDECSRFTNELSFIISWRSEYRSPVNCPPVCCHENLCLATCYLPRLIRCYSIQRERDYQDIAQQWTSALAPLFRLSVDVCRFFA
jgi:hypothetical protein